LDIDLSTKHYGIHFGVYRSSIRTPKQFTSVLQCVKQKKRIVLDGIMGYEAQLAGVPDKDPEQKIKSSVIRHLKRKSKSEVVGNSKDCLNTVRNSCLSIRFVNEGGSGILNHTTGEKVASEVTVGLGFIY